MVLAFWATSGPRAELAEDRAGMLHVRAWASPSAKVGPRLWRCEARTAPPPALGPQPTLARFSTPPALVSRHQRQPRQSYWLLHTAPQR